MFKLYIWGAGYYAQQVIDEIDNMKAHIIAIIDSDKKKQGTNVFSPIPIVSPSEILSKEFDFIIISVKNYKSIKTACEKLGIASDKIIVYWNVKFDNDIFIDRSKRIEELEKKNKILQCRLDSIPYELGVQKTPRILSSIDLLKKIINDNSSLCRFGDGEFEMIRENERPWFQKPDTVLSMRLKEILLSEDDSITIAIAQNFIHLDQYRESAADDIRKYMFGNTRKYILKLIDINRIYYDAYVSRPYIIYKSKKNADQIFPLFKEIWKDRDIAIIEGEYSRIAVGNDLMDSARSVIRVLCPSENAWDKYDLILNTVLKKITKKTLICISLGPCATVLAYDLAKEGYQALDIGQLDNEYEWYLRNAEKRIKIPGKMVAELALEQRFELNDEAGYRKQIIASII